MSVPSLLVCVPLLSVSPLVPQGVYQGRSYGLALPPSGAAARTVVGELNGDPFPDVVQMLGGGEAVILFDPGELESVVPVPGLRTDVAILPGGAPAGCDALVELGADGLRTTWLDANGQLVSGSFFAPQVAGGALVRSLDLGGGLGNVLAAVDGARMKLCLYDDAAPHGLVGTWTMAGIEDVLDLQWNGAGNREIGVLAESGLVVLDASSLMPVWSLGSYSTGGRIARVSQASPSEERLAWITGNPLGGQWLLVVGPSSPVEFVDLGQLGATSLRSADYDGNKFGDLFIGHTYQYEPLALISHRSASASSAVAFDGGLSQLLVFPLGHPGPALENLAEPALADFDRDGDLDVVCALGPENRAVVMRGEAIDESSLKPVLAGPVIYDTEKEELVLPIQAPGGVALAEGTRLRIDVWRESAVSGSMNRTRFARHEQLFRSASQVRVPVPEAGAHLHGLQFRFVNGDGVVSPSENAFLTFDAGLIGSWQLHWTGPFMLVTETIGTDPGGGLVCNPTIGPFIGGGPNP